MVPGAYEFQIRVKPDGVWSSASREVVVSDSPELPPIARLIATAGDGFVTLDWRDYPALPVSLPANHDVRWDWRRRVVGGSWGPFTLADVVDLEGAETCTAQAVRSLPSSVRTIELRNVEAGRTYEYQLRVRWAYIERDDMGQLIDLECYHGRVSPTSNPVTPTGSGSLQPPTDLMVTSTRTGTMTVSWTPPVPPPFQYLVQWSEGSENEDGQVTWTDAGTPRGTATELTISGLVDGTPYTVRVCSQGADGRPDPSTSDDWRRYCALAQGTAGRSNQRPVVGRDLADVTVAIGASAVVSLLGVFTDPDPGDKLECDVQSQKMEIATATVQNPCVSVTVVGLNVGDSLITVSATDGPEASGQSVVTTFTVTVTPEPVNLPPVPDQVLPDVTVGVGQTHSVTLAGAFIDPEGDAISYTPAPSITRPDIATLSALQSGSFTITGIQAGSARVSVSATDGRAGPGRPAVQFFEVTVTPEPVNQPPVAGDAELPDRDLPLGAVVVIDLAGAFVDPENDPLAYAATASMPNVLLVGSIPAGATTFELRGRGVGESLVSVTADDRQDGPGRPARRDFTVTVALTAPKAVDGLRVTIDESSIVTATWTPLDSLWDATYDVEARPGAGLEGEEPRLVSGSLEPPVLFTDLVPGTWSVRIRATNRVGDGPWSEPVEIAVTEPPPAVFRFGRADLPVPKPSLCPRPDTLYIKEGFMEVHLDRSVDFEVEVEVEVIPEIDPEIDDGLFGHVVLEQPGPTSANQGVATFAPGVTTVRFVARVECRVKLGDVYTFVLRYPRAPYGGGTAAVDPDHARLKLTVGTPVTALPAGGAVLLAALLVAVRLRRRRRGDLPS